MIAKYKIVEEGDRLFGKVYAVYRRSWFRWYLLNSYKEFSDARNRVDIEGNLSKQEANTYYYCRRGKYI